MKQEISNISILQVSKIPNVNLISILYKNATIIPYLCA